MADYMADVVRDNGLAYIGANADEVILCSADPGGVYGSISALATISVTSGDFTLQDGTPDGREVEVGVLSGTGSGDGNAVHWVVAASGVILVGVDDASPYTVSTGQNFSTTAFACARIRDAT